MTIQNSFVRDIRLQIGATTDLALIASDDSVWVVVSVKWWDLASWLWYFLQPSDKRAVIHLTLGDERRMRVRAVRVATRHARLKGRVSS